jgi:hypothetical protein
MGTHHEGPVPDAFTMLELDHRNVEALLSLAASDERGSSSPS